MDALANGRVGSLDAVMVWARMRWSMDGLVAWTSSWFGHGYTCQRSYHGLGIDTLADGRSDHGRYHGLGMDALAHGWVGSMDAVTAWAWMH